MSLGTFYQFDLVDGTNPRVNDFIPQCVENFNNNYGVWHQNAPKPFKPGQRIKLNARRLTSQCLVDPGNTVLSVCTLNGQLIGHAFASFWAYGQETNICWVTQLVVDARYRRRGIAARLLRQLPGATRNVSAFGVDSSHPGALLALAKRTGRPFTQVNLDFMKEHVPGILRCSTVPYIAGGRLHGSLFEADSEATSGTVCSVDTNFYVSHDEPLAALKEFEHIHGDWPLGSLLEGHEYLLVIPA